MSSSPRRWAAVAAAALALPLLTACGGEDEPSLVVDVREALIIGAAGSLDSIDAEGSLDSRAGDGPATMTGSSGATRALSTPTTRLTLGSGATSALMTGNGSSLLARDKVATTPSAASARMVVLATRAEL